MSSRAREIVRKDVITEEAARTDQDPVTDKLSTTDFLRPKKSQLVDLNLPASTLIDREKIKLPRIPASQIAAAKTLAKHLKQTYRGLASIHDEYRSALDQSNELGKSAREKLAECRQNKRTPEAKRLIAEYHELRDNARELSEQRDELKEILDSFPIKPKGSSCSFENLALAAEQGIERLKSEGSWKKAFSSPQEQDVIILTALFCVKFSGNPHGFLSILPDSTIGQETEAQLHRSALLAKYFFTEFNKLSTASELEQLRKWSAKLTSSKLGKLMMFQYTDLVEMAFPGFQEGEEPRIREWLLPGTNKWNPNESNQTEVLRRTIKACRSTFRAIGILTADGRVDLDLLKSTNLGEEFHKARHGLRGMTSGPHVRGTLDIIELGLPGLLGTAPHQIPAWKLKTSGKWEGEHALQLIDQITRHIVENKLRLLRPDGKLHPDKTKAIEDWVNQFNSECSSCLTKAGVTNAYTALKRCYPDSFGWADDKIKPGDIRFSGMWQNKEGKQLFRLRFAWILYSRCNALNLDEVKFSENSTQPFRISRKDFLALMSNLSRNSISWQDVMRQANFTAGFSSVAENNIEKAFAILFGDPVKGRKKELKYPGTNIQVEDVKDRQAGRTSLIALASTLIPGDPFIGSLDFSTVTSARHLRDRASIRGTCLERLLAHNPPSKLRESSKVFYDAFAVSVMPSQNKDDQGAGSDRYTALQKILEARDVNGDLVFTNPRIGTFLNVLREIILPELTLEKHIKDKLATFLTAFCASNKIPRRQIILEAIALDPDLSDNTLLALTNQIVEFVFEKILYTELENQKTTGSFSTNYETRSQQVNYIEDTQDESEELSADESNPKVEEELDSKSTEEKVKKRKLEDWIEETMLVAIGQKAERQSFLSTIAKMNRDREFWRKNVGDFSALNIIEEHSLVRQIGARLKLRSLDRLDYRTLRARMLPSEYLSSILDNDSPEGQSINLDFIDVDLFSRLPNGWPKQFALPLLYFGGVAHVGLINSDASKKFKSYADSAPRFKYELYPLTENNWRKLSEFSKSHIQFQEYDPQSLEEAFLMGRVETKLLYETLAHLRRDLYRVQKRSKKGG